MKYLLLSLTAFMLASCGASLQTYNNLYDLRKGQSYSKDVMDYEDYIHKSYTSNYNGNDYKILTMKMITSFINIVNPASRNRNNYSNNNSGLDRHDVGAGFYYLIYESKKLVYWGFRYEINRYENDTYENVLNNMVLVEENE